MLLCIRMGVELLHKKSNNSSEQSETDLVMSVLFIQLVYILIKGRLTYSSGFFISNNGMENVFTQNERNKIPDSINLCLFDFVCYVGCYEYAICPRILVVHSGQCSILLDGLSHSERRYTIGKVF